MELRTEQKGALNDLAQRVRNHFDNIEQDVPDQSFLIGGAVRDALLGLESNDFDFVVVGESLETMEARGFEPIEASSFPVLHDSEHEEWALARTEQKTGEGYTGFDVFTDDVSLEDDLERRDLSINSMALSADPGLSPEWFLDSSIVSDDETWGLIDLHGGVEDIENGVLRHVSDAFAEDPLRVMRVSRYAGRFAVPVGERATEFVEKPDGGAVKRRHTFASEQDSVVIPGFHVASETEDMMRQVVPELNRMSRDRIADELLKALRQARRPSRIFEVLRDSGALAVLLPELDRGTQVLSGPPEHHQEGSVFRHSAMVLDRMSRLCDENDIEGRDRTRRLMMALAHDLGKIFVADKQGGIHSDDPPTRFGGHAERGAEIVPSIARRLGLSSEFENVMQDACAKHMKVHNVPAMAPNELLEFLGDAIHRHPDSGRTLATTPSGDPISVHGATAWELVDLAHADEEGRLKSEEVTGSGTTHRLFRPDFDREPFERRIEAVRKAHDVEGYEALETGLCDEHRSASGNSEGGCVIDRTNGIHVEEDRSVQSVMASCVECRTPGEWVGDMLDSMRVERLQKELSESVTKI